MAHAPLEDQRRQRPVARGGCSGLAVYLLLGVTLHAFSATPEPAAPTEYEVKAAFLYHFARLVEWPLAADDKPFVLAVVGPDPFGHVLEDAIGSRQVRGRAVRIDRYRRSADARHDHPQLLFVAASESREVERALAAVEGAPVLTVGELDAFAEQGGMIGFRITPEGRVTFDINRAEAERAGLKLSSQLLKLARIVEKAP